MRFLGNVNITRRQFYKSKKQLSKIARHVGESIVLYEYHVSNEKEYNPIDTLLTDLGYDQGLINNIKDAVLTNSSSPTIKIGEIVEF